MWNKNLCTTGVSKHKILYHYSEDNSGWSSYFAVNEVSSKAESWLVESLVLKQWNVLERKIVTMT